MARKKSENIDSTPVVKDPLAPQMIWDHIKNLTENKIPYNDIYEECKKTFDIYMANRIISMNQGFLLLCNTINRLSKTLTREQVYNIYFNMIPQRKIFFGYIKKPKELNANEKECLCKYFDFGSRDLDLALKILTEEQIYEVVQKYNVGKK